jgi:hypothetical protein
MSLTETERKEKARIFDLLVNNYGVPGRVLNPRNHPRIFTVVDMRTDLKALDRG